MLGRKWAAPAAAGILLLASAGSARADEDTFRLGGTGDADTMTLGASGAEITTLGFDGDVDTYLTRGGRGGGFGGGRGGGFGGGFGRGGFGGGRGFGGGFYGGGRGFSVGYYGGGRGYGGFGGGRSYGGWYGGRNSFYGGGYGFYNRGFYNRGFYGGYNSCYYQPYYYSNFCQPYYYDPYSYNNYYYSCNGDSVAVTATIGGTTTLNAPQYQPPFMPPAQDDKNQTFPYDGGPNAPTPKPGDVDPASQPGPRPTVPREGRIAVGSPLPSPYAAYGSAPTIPVKVGFTAPASTANFGSAPVRGIAYPAYGEQTKTVPVGTLLTRNK